jgi:NitT/TauT family transport system substrate-binding protein
MPTVESRRHFLTQLATAGVVGLGGIPLARGRSFAAEPSPPEVTTIRFGKFLSTCTAPVVALGLLRAEGFTDIRYVDYTDANFAAKSGPVVDMIEHDEIDLGWEFAPNLVLGMSAGAPVTVLAGLHLGCFDVWAKSDIRSLTGLKGRTVGLPKGGASVDKVILRILVSLVGLDPDKDILWVTSTESGTPADLFYEGKIDALLAVPPFRQELIARNIGHVIFSSVTDRPWSPILLLLPRNQHKVRATVSGCDQTGASCQSQGYGFMRLPARAFCPTACRTRVYDALRLCPQGAERASLRRLAGLRPGGHAAVLRAPAARGGFDQVQPAEADRRAHRLALPQRTQARVEGLIHASAADRDLLPHIGEVRPGAA